MVATFTQTCLEIEEIAGCDPVTLGFHRGLSYGLSSSRVWSGSIPLRPFQAPTPEAVMTEIGSVVSEMGGKQFQDSLLLTDRRAKTPGPLCLEK